MIGQTFGCLTVIKEAGSVKGRKRWLCRCSCGKETVVWESHEAERTLYDSFLENYKKQKDVQ